MDPHAGVPNAATSKFIWPKSSIFAEIAVFEKFREEK